MFAFREPWASFQTRQVLKALFIAVAILAAAAEDATMDGSIDSSDDGDDGGSSSSTTTDMRSSYLEDDASITRALRGEGAFGKAIDKTVALASGTLLASKNKRCFENLEALMIRNRIPTTAAALRFNLSDAELLRLGLLASIALISPWDQHPMDGRLLISDRGVLLEAYHPSTSESDIMLCVVCSLLAIIIMFHVAQ